MDELVFVGSSVHGASDIEAPFRTKIECSFSRTQEALKSEHLLGSTTRARTSFISPTERSLLRRMNAHSFSRPSKVRNLIFSQTRSGNGSRSDKNCHRRRSSPINLPVPRPSKRNETVLVWAYGVPYSAPACSQKARREIAL